MPTDLEPIFGKYEELRKEADIVFDRVAELYPERVKCHAGCDDCCSALFDLSLVEAMYINRAFNKAFGHGPERSKILERASRIDRNLTRIKREIYQAEKAGESHQQIMEKVAGMRMPCPLLDDDKKCALYADRPIICRLYGIPCAINGQAHVCSLSGFNGGEKFPTAQLGKIQERLEQMSRDIAKAVQSRFELHDVYVPLSMALLNCYDDAYLGIGEAGKEE